MELVAAGRAFLLTGGRPGDKPHMWVVLTDPDPLTNHVVAVMLVSAKAHTDPTCALSAGDHPFIKHDTHADYGGAKLFPAQRVNKCLAIGRCKLHEDVSAQVLTKLRAGLLTSQRTVHFVLEHCRQRFPK